MNLESEIDEPITSKLSVVILTQDEECCIQRCLSSVIWADEVLVLDSGSTDTTCLLAQKMGAVVHHQEWLGYAKQRNKAAELASNDWVFFVDADEIVTPQLRYSVEVLMSSSKNSRDGFSMSRRGDFLGVLLPDASPPWRKRNFIRIFNKLENRFDENMQVHESVKLSGKAEFLNGDLLHWNGHSIEKYIADINRYSEAEAEALFDQGKSPALLWIPIRFLLRFLWCYLACQEFKLGARGFLHSFLAATAEYIRYTKLWEKNHALATLDPPSSLYLEE